MPFSFASVIIVFILYNGKFCLIGMANHLHSSYWQIQLRHSDRCDSGQAQFHAVYFDIIALIESYDTCLVPFGVNASVIAS